MYVATVPNRNSPPAILLRESFRLGGKVRNRTLSNLSHWPPAQLDALRSVLKGATSIGAPLPQAFDIVRSRPHRSEEHTSELQSPCNLVCRLLLEKKILPAPVPAGCPPRPDLAPSCGPSAAPVPGGPPLRPDLAPAWGRATAPASHLFFFNDTPTTEIYTLSLHDALPIWWPMPPTSRAIGRFTRLRSPGNEVA